MPVLAENWMYSTTIILQVLQTEHSLFLAVGVWSVHLVLMRNLGLFICGLCKARVGCYGTIKSLIRWISQTHTTPWEPWTGFGKSDFPGTGAMHALLQHDLHWVIACKYQLHFHSFRETLWSTIKYEAPSCRLSCSPLSYTSKYSFFILIVLHYCSYLFVSSFQPVKIPLNLISMFSRNFLYVKC